MPNHLSLIPGWKPLLVLALPVLLGIGTVGAAYLYTSATTHPGQMTAADAAAAATAGSVDIPAPAGLLVHVVGAVERPGLYRMKRGDRVYDAIASAGGLSVEADIPRLPNLAARLKAADHSKLPSPKCSPRPPLPSS